jgi:hypothetical protein
LDGASKCENGTATYEVIKEHMKVTGQHMSVTNFTHKNWYVFCSKKNEIAVKMNTE